MPIDAEPIRDAVLVTRGGRIVAIGPAGSVDPAPRHEELPDAAILPGLVNAHCHLELTGLRAALPRGAPMHRWLAKLLRLRSRRDRAADAAAGAAELLARGCTLVGDICSDEVAWAPLKRSPIRKVCFAEVLGVGPLAVGALARARRRLAEAPEPDDRLGYGLSPHAPYTTAETLARRTVALAAKRALAVTTHLAETPAERRLLVDGAGPMVGLLRRAGALDHTFGPAGAGPMRWARRVGLLAGGAALAHVNDVTDAELDLLAETSASVVYCPRSNDFFGRSGHRYREMLARGINVALGSDSLASNDSLDMLAEMRAVWAQRRIDAATVLRMGTRNGAAALGMDGRTGSLAPGKQADWIALACPVDDAPAEAILAGDQPVTRVVIAGEPVTR